MLRHLSFNAEDILTGLVTIHQSRVCLADNTAITYHWENTAERLPTSLGADRLEVGAAGKSRGY
jgi:hypothetical protein